MFRICIPQNLINALLIIYQVILCPQILKNLFNFFVEVLEKRFKI